LAQYSGFINGMGASSINARTLTALSDDSGKIYQKWCKPQACDDILATSDNRKCGSAQSMCVQ
jgi:hypothetical protein